MKNQEKAVRKNKNELGKKSHEWHRLIWPGLILVITFISFYPSLKNGFNNWDDNAYVFENIHLNKPIPEGVTYFFGPHYFVGNYIPVTMITYLLEFHIAGLNPQFFHSVNLAIHLLNVMLVFWLIYLLSGKKIMVATIVAGLFGVHPMHVESVAWISELKDVLYTFFFIGGLIAYYKYGSSPLKKDFKLMAVTFLLFIVSVLCKPAAIVFPVVLLIIDFYRDRKFEKSVWLEKLPFFIISILFGIITLQAQQTDRLLHDYYPFSQRLFFACHSLIEYIFKLFLPINLSIFYPYPKLQEGHLPFFYYITSVIVVLLFYGIYRTLKYSKLTVFGFLFFLANIFLVLQLISVGDAVMADRYTYVPYIGLFFIMATGFYNLYHHKNSKIKPYKIPAAAGVIILVITCAVLTNSRCEVWRDGDSLAADLLEKFPDDRLALNNQGYLVYEKGRYEESVKLFTKAIEMRPDYMMAYINLANSYIAMPDYEKALNVIDTALKHAPKDYNVLNRKGIILNLLNRHEEALTFYKEALKYKPGNYTVMVNMSKTYEAMHDTANSEKYMDMALTYEPGNYQVINAKGYLLFSHGKTKEAMTLYNEAIRLKPDYVTPYINLAECYYNQHDYENALSVTTLGLKYAPDNYILLNNKGYIFFVMNKFNDALEYYKRSLRMNPDYITANMNLANCYRALGDNISASTYDAIAKKLETKNNR